MRYRNSVVPAVEMECEIQDVDAGGSRLEAAARRVGGALRRRCETNHYCCASPGSSITALCLSNVTSRVLDVVTRAARLPLPLR